MGYLAADRTRIGVRKKSVRNIALASCLALGLAGPSFAQSKASIEADGTVVVPSFRLPPSVYLSDAARAAMPRRPTDLEAVMYQALAAGKVGEMRKRIPEFTADRVRHLVSLYPVSVQRTSIAGIPAMTVTPPNMPAANRDKILLDLPGGGFVMGTADGTGLSESIPLAAIAKVKVVSITYRQAPEAMFPAATDDVVAVYRALRKEYRAEDIGIFGCSAGGLLTAETVARLEMEKLPLPRAIGIFCASADARWAGDSRAYARPFQALPVRDAPRNYFTEKDLTDPLASPVLSPAILARFPPTLILTATRAMEMSAAVSTHRELVKAGVDAELHVWDGLGHAFFYNPDLPESKDAFAVMARFFTRHMKLAQ